MQAITTKYLGPTDTKGGRIKASADARSIIIPYPHEPSGQEASHAKAAMELVRKLGWTDSWPWVAGGLPGNDGYVFVCTNPVTRSYSARD